MSRRIIPLTDISRASDISDIALPGDNAPLHAPAIPFTDTFSRPLRDLRISVTDRCNFRCVYCMPRATFGADYPFLPHSELLSLEEIERVASIFVAHGVEKIRITGGEPLLRKNLEFLIERLARLTTLEGRTPDITLTTNGALLARRARGLRDAGLQRVTVSLDALDDELFKRMNDADFASADVLAGIEAAQAVGLAPIKVNMVVKRGTNDGEILPMARHFRGTGVALRFIEYMDVGATNGWNLTEVLPSSEVLARIAAEFPLEAVTAHDAAETAKRWRYLDGAGEIGLISSVTQAFCGDCTRARLSTDGKLYLCLFAAHGHDLRALLRGGKSDAEIAASVAQLWTMRTDRYSQLRGQLTPTPARVEMSYIGG